MWRIGIKYSSNHDIQFNNTAFPINGCVALYPQMRGSLDTGVREYDWNPKENMFTHFSLGFETDLKEYSRDTLHRIIQSYFEMGIPCENLPTIVLQEQVESFIDESNRFFEKSDSNEYSLSEIRHRFVLLHNNSDYLQKARKYGHFTGYKN